MNKPVKDNPIDVDALEQELFKAFAQHTQKQKDLSEPFINSAQAKDLPIEPADVLSQLAVESELAIHHPELLKAQKTEWEKLQVTEDDLYKQNDELHTLLHPDIRQNERDFSLDKQSHMDDILNRTYSIDDVLNELPNDSLNIDLFTSNAEIDPLRLFQLGEKPIQQATPNIKTSTNQAERDRYRGSLDAQIDMPLPEGERITNPVEKNKHIESSDANLFDESPVDDILDLIPDLTKKPS